MTEIWVFVAILSYGGMQFSDSYRTHSDCESARLEVLARGTFNGQEIASTKQCGRLR